VLKRVAGHLTHPRRLW